MVGGAACSPPAPVEADRSFATTSPATLRAGAAAIPITPDWSVYLAGGIPYRPSLNVHDDIWARAIVLDDGAHRVALVALDLIGLYYDDVLRIRADIADQTPLDYVLIATTHTHNGPDTLDLWSPDPLCIDDPYRRFLGARVAQAVAQAAASLEPATLRVAVGDSGDLPLSRDTRKPEVIDDSLIVWQIVGADSEQPIATSVHYAAHPILIPSFNFDISSDFVHTLRVALESGMTHIEGDVQPLGGVCLFFNGALGGRISPANGDPPTEAPPLDPAYAFAETYGYRLARRARQVFDESAESFTGPAAIAVRSRQLDIPVANPIFTIGMSTCLLERRFSQGRITTEVAVVTVGPLQFFAVPGMIFPELVIGDLAPLPGSDFPDAPIEAPPLGKLVSVDKRFVCIGLANDMLGYLIPRVLWDSAPPFTTDNNKPPYGENISPGPDTAPIIMEAFAELQGE